MEKTSNTGKKIQSVQRAIDILNCFSSNEPALSLGEISSKLGLNKATVHGLLNTLHYNDYVCQNSKGQYLLGNAIFRKAQLESSAFNSKLVDYISADLQKASNKFKASCFVLAVYNNNLLRIHSLLPTNCAFVLQPHANEGPLHAMASGKLLLAFADSRFVNDYFSRTRLEKQTAYTLTKPEQLNKEFETIRKNSYSFEQDELVDGISAIAVPIFNSQHDLYASISLTGITANILNSKASIVEALKRIAAKAEDAVLI